MVSAGHRGAPWGAEWWLGRRVRFITGIVGTVVAWDNGAIVATDDGRETFEPVGALNQRLLRGSVEILS
jgi:hypothetical protein